MTTDKIHELGERALNPITRGCARAMLKVAANNPKLSPKCRRLAARLRAESSTLEELRADMGIQS